MLAVNACGSPLHATSTKGYACAAYRCVPTLPLYANYQTIRPILAEEVPARLCRGFLHMPLRLHDAVYVALCGRTDWQGPVGRHSGAVFLVYGHHARAAGTAAGLAAGFAHHLRQLGRNLRTAGHEGCRHSALPHHAPVDARSVVDDGRILLLSEFYLAAGPKEPAHAAHQHEAAVACGRDSRGRVLQRRAQHQPFRAEEECRNGHALPAHHLQNGPRLRPRTDCAGRLGENGDDQRQAAPRATPVER